MTALASSIQFHFVWRVSQVAHPIHAITCAQVKFMRRNGEGVAFPWGELRADDISSIVIHQTSSKTGVRRAAMSLVNEPEREAELIERIVQWSKLANWTSEHEMFFSVTYRSPITQQTYTKRLQASDVMNMVKTIAEELGMDPAFFGSHSLRSGGATNLLINGVAREAINYYAGWNPDGNTMNLYTAMTHHQPGALSALHTQEVHRQDLNLLQDASRLRSLALTREANRRRSGSSLGITEGEGQLRPEPRLPGFPDRK